MTLRKGKNKTARKEAAPSKKLRTSLPLPRPKELVPEVVLHTGRGKNYAWIVEGIKREFLHKKRTSMPRDLKPELATIREAPFNDADWQFEIKWDGYRALAYVQDGKADLRSRNNTSFNRKFAPVADALKEWPVKAVVDGEVVVLSEEGKADFAALQAWGKQPAGQLVYYVFDLLWVEGVDLQKEPLSVRREVLRRIVPDSGIIRYSDSIDEYGTDFFKAAREAGLEGIIAKRKSAPYKAATRTKDWFKIKAEKRHEALICGYTRKQGTDRNFSSLVLGLPSEQGLQFIGQVGTGFSSAAQLAILQKLRPLTTKQCPFAEEPPITEFVQWVRPFLVCEVKYTERTADGLMRHPSFQGLREDKTPADLNKEEEPEANDAPQMPTSPSRDTLVAKGEKTALLTLNGQELKLTNLGKVYWPGEGITKGDLLNYYHAAAPYILPYLKDRPQSLNRHPDGISGKSFYQKDIKGKAEGWLNTFERFSESGGGAKDFLVCTNEASLLYMVNLGCIELNPWHSRVGSPHYPDWCVIDLDPGDIPFEKVIETALVVQQVLDSLHIPSYPKTSGSTGLHIYIPLGAKYNYDQSRQLAEIIATLVHTELPRFTSLVRSPEKRKDKIYIDYLQNRPIQTICAPYSVRPRQGATVSAPLHWTEVKKGLQLSQFTLHNMTARLKREGDLFEGVLGEGINLNAVVQKLTALL